MTKKHKESKQKAVRKPATRTAGKAKTLKSPIPKRTKELPQKPARTLKEEKLFQNLLRTASQFMSGKGYKPMTASELMLRLHLPPQHVDAFHDVLHGLVAQGHIELTHRGYIWKESQVPTVTGVLRVHPRGFGFLRPEDPTLYPEDIFIPKHLTMNAVDGDTVEVIVNVEGVSEKGPEGRVVAILSRGRTHVAGTIREVTAYGDIYAYVPLLGASQQVFVEPPGDRKLQAGDRLVMEVLEWGSKEKETICRMSHYIGHISDPGVDISAAVEEYEIRSEFPSRAIKEAQEFGEQVPRQELEEREDLRKVECFTIDPDTAKDYDDALSLKVDRKGGFELGVHIADVSHYVRPGTALDKEARLRCNSTYFPGVCIPMLPGELSNNLCSLKEAVNRLTISVFVRFDKEGNQQSYRIARTVIKSAKRFTYREAKEVLDGKKKSKHLATLKRMMELCHLLKRKRYERGSIEFSLPEQVVLVDSHGVPQGLDTVEYDITHQMVEEFMLKANEIVATHLSAQGKNLTYRIHDEPSEENLKDFSILARAFGFDLSEKPTQKEMQKLFDEAVHTPFGQYLASSYIRRMRLAIYSPDNIGHYGLGLTHYCHFTSPIRRYVDLVVHRILFGESDDLENLETIAADCSEQERISAKAESSVVLLKKLRYLRVLQENEPKRQYEAVITRIKPFGFFFEVLDFMLESFLHVSEIGSDFYVFEESQMRLRGRWEGKAYCAGDKITVMLKEVDFITLESDWHMVSDKPEKNRSEMNRSERNRSEKKKEPKTNKTQTQRKDKRRKRK